MTLQDVLSYRQAVRMGVDRGWISFRDAESHRVWLETVVKNIKPEIAMQENSPRCIPLDWDKIKSTF